MTTKHFLARLHGGFVLLDVHESGAAAVLCEDESGRPIKITGRTPEAALERATKGAIANHLGWDENEVRQSVGDRLELVRELWGVVVTAPSATPAASKDGSYVPETRPAHLPSYIDWHPGMLVAAPTEVDPTLPSWLAQERKPAPSAGPQATTPPPSSAPNLSSLPVIPMTDLSPEVRAAVDNIQRSNGITPAEERGAPSLDDLPPGTRETMEAIHRARVDSTAARVPLTLPVPPEYAGAGDASKPE